MKTLFEIQSESGQSWPDIKALLDAAAAEVADLKAQLESGKSILEAHQKESDRLATQAEAAFAAGDVAALPGIIAEAKLFGTAREKKKLLEEAEKLKAECENLNAKARELEEKAAAL